MTRLCCSPRHHHNHNHNRNHHNNRNHHHNPNGSKLSPPTPLWPGCTALPTTITITIIITIQKDHLRHHQYHYCQVVLLSPAQSQSQSQSQSSSQPKRIKVITTNNTMTRLCCSPRHVFSYPGSMPGIGARLKRGKPFFKSCRFLCFVKITFSKLLPLSEYPRSTIMWGPTEMENIAKLW